MTAVAIAVVVQVVAVQPTLLVDSLIAAELEISDERLIQNIVLRSLPQSLVHLKGEIEILI